MLSWTEAGEPSVGTLAALPLRTDLAEDAPAGAYHQAARADHGAHGLLSRSPEADGAERDRMIDPLKSLLFILLSTVAVVASLHAWRTRQTYGILRFFAFESLVVLIVWNAGRWFRDPLSISQMVSWGILAASTALAAHGFHLLKVAGGARARIMEDTQIVVRVGAYRYIRHPLYASLMFLGWGVFFKGCDLASAGLASAATAFWIATARCEERFNIDRFGAAYSEYMRCTKMFVPFVL